MKTLCFLAMLLIAPPAWATIITFDDPGIQSYYYQGDARGWTYYVANAATSYWSGYMTLVPLHEEVWQSTYGNTTPFPSSNTAMYNLSGLNSLSLSGPLSTVEGFWMAPFGANDGWYDPYSAHTVTVQGWGESWALVGTTVLNLTPGFHYYDLGFTAPVHELTLRTNTNAPQWYVLDDLTLSYTPEALADYLRPPETPVPEPSTWLYCLIGLVIVGWFHIKRRVLR